MAILFADTSAYQSRVDLGEYVKHSPLIALKATEGTDYADSRFKARWQEAGRRGLVRVAYHFIHAQENRPKGEADHFFTTVKAAGLRRGDILCLDCEAGKPGPAQNRRWLGECIAHLDARSHHYARVRPAWLYAGNWFAENVSQQPIRDRYLWYPAYGSGDAWGFSTRPRAWSKRSLLIAHQFTDGSVGPGPHSIAGIGNCDLNMFQGGRLRLARVAGLSASQTAKLVTKGHL